MRFCENCGVGLGFFSQKKVRRPDGTTVFLCKSCALRPAEPLGFAPTAPSLKHGQAARTLLEKRGLTSEVAVAAERLIEKLGTAREPQVTGPSAEEQQQAEDLLWAWYREWSTIARSAISDRRLLRAMGFLKKSAAEELVDDPDELDEPDAAASATSIGASA